MYQPGWEEHLDRQAEMADRDYLVHKLVQYKRKQMIG